VHWKLTIAYDGTGLVGWQRQLTGPSVQALLEDAIAPLEGAPVVVHGAGRTDSGVHAWGQVASVTLHRAVAPDIVVRAVNSRLPLSVRVLSAEEVDADFHARFLARGKTYRYRIWNGEVLDPFERNYVWHIAGPRLDADAMADAARHLVGQHDFAAFEGAGGDVRSSVRTIFRSTVSAVHTPRGGPLVTYEVSGNGFLRYMVRSIVGSLVDVGRGYRQASWMADVVASRDRAKAGRTAPAAGLVLVSVEYEEPDL
jgi:tRNA pseudouridine38-40 synthase